MMIKVLRDLLRAYRKEHASNQIKLKKSKLLIYDEYLNKYVSADELLIPGVKVKYKGADTLTKSKELFVFDVLFKKFVNPKLDLLVPGTPNLEYLIQGYNINKKEDIKTSSRDFFWGKKASKKNAVFPLPPVHKKTCTDTEPPQIGWAGQKTKKPETDPRPELAKPECKLGSGPGKDPKKKKAPKKKSKKNKYLICKKVNKLDKNVKEGANNMDAEQKTTKSSKEPKEIIYNEENCYSDSKENKKQPMSQHSVTSVSKTPLEPVANKEAVSGKLMKESGKNSCYNNGMFKIISSKLFSKELTGKAPTKRESISDPHNKPNVFDHKTNTSRKVDDKDNNKLLKEPNKNSIKTESNLKSNQSKALVCKNSLPSSLIPSQDSKTTNIYLCKEHNNNKHQNENTLNKTDNMYKKDVCSSGAAITNEIKSNKIESLIYKKDEKVGDKSNNTCLKSVKVADCSKTKSIKEPSLDQIKCECKKTIERKQNISPIETSDSLKAKDCTSLSNTQSGINKDRTSPYNFMERPKTVYLPKPCPKSSDQSSGGCNSNTQNIVQVNNKPEHKNDESCKCASSEKLKVKDKCNKTNDPEKNKSPECNTLKRHSIDPKSTEKLQCIAQEEFFKRADLSTDLTKRSSYLGFKIKKQSSKTNPTENGPKDHTKDCPKTQLKESHSKKKDKSNTDLKKSKSQDDCTQPKINRDSIKACKSETVLNGEHTKQALNKKPQDCKELVTKSTCQSNDSSSNTKQEPKSKKVHGSDSKGKVKGKKSKTSQKKSSIKLSKKCKSKSSPTVKAVNSKSKEVGKKKKVCSSSTEHNKKQQNEKSNLCTKPSVSSNFKDLNENKNSGKEESCCNTLTDQTGQGQVKQECCKQIERESDKPCSEKTTAPATSDKDRCPTERENKKTPTSIGEHKPKKMSENNGKAKPKVCLKHIITGATQKKKMNICKKVKSFESFKSDKSNKLSKSKVKNNCLDKPQTDKEPLEKSKTGKSAKVCSEKKSRNTVDKNSKNSKSKQSISSKTEKGKNSSKSHKGEKLTKLNKLVQRAKCSTGRQNKKEKAVVKNAIICSKSTPSIKPVKPNETSGMSKPNEDIPKTPLTPNTSGNNSKKAKASKNEMKNTKIRSLHTLQKIMAEPSVKSSKTDTKSFSELKTMNNNYENKNSAEHFDSSSYSSRLNIQLNNHKTERTNAKYIGITEERKLQSVEHKTEQNDLKTFNQRKNELIYPKNKNFSQYLKNDKYFQLLLTSLTHETEHNKQNSKIIFKVDSNACKNDNLIKGTKDQRKLVSKNHSKEHSKDTYKVCDSKNKCQKSSNSILYKTITNSIDTFLKTNNTNNKFNIQNDDIKLDKKETTISSKIMNEDFQVNNKLTGRKSISNISVSPLFRGSIKEAFLKEGFSMREGFKNQLNEGTVSKVQLKAVDTLNTAIKSENQTVRPRSAAVAKSVDKSVRVPQKTLNPCKTKSFSSFNSLQLNDKVPKHLIRSLQSPKRKANKDVKIKTLKVYENSKDQEFINAKMTFSPQNKVLDKCQPFTKNEKGANSSENKISQTSEKSSFGSGFVAPRKLQLSQVNQQKNLIKRVDVTGHFGGRKNNVSNEKILCDFIEGSFDVNVQNIEPQYLSKNSKVIKNEKWNLKSLKHHAESQNAEKESINKQCSTVSKNNLGNNGSNKNEPHKVSRSSMTNKTLIIDGLENHVSKLETIAPSMKRIFKPVFLNTRLSVGNEHQERNKKELAVKTPINDKILEQTIQKVPETENQDIKENINIRQTSSNIVDKKTIDRIVINVNNTLNTPINSENQTEITVKDCSSNTLKSNVKTNEIKKKYFLKEKTTSKTPIISKYSPKLKSKVQLISKRHKKFTNYNHKKTLTTAKKEIDMHKFLKTNNTAKKLNIQKSEPIEAIKTHSYTSNENNIREKQDNKGHLNKTTSLSSKESSLLTKQPFYKQPKFESSNDNLAFSLEAETSLVASDKEIANGRPISCPNQPARELRWKVEQTFTKQQKSENSENSLCNSKSKNCLPKTRPSRNIDVKQLQSSKSDNDLVAPIKNNAKDVASPKLFTRQLRLLMEQPFAKQPKSETYTKKTVCNSKSENSLPKPRYYAANELQSSKSENDLVAPNKNNISPGKQHSSIRSKLLKKKPIKADKKVNLKITGQE